MENEEQALSVEEMKKHRQIIRSKITRLWRKSQSNQFDRFPTSVSELNKLYDQLSFLDENIGENDDETYYTKLGSIKDKLTKQNIDEHSSSSFSSAAAASTSSLSQINTTRVNDARLKPFDGKCRNYAKFEKLFNSKYLNNAAYNESDCFLKFEELTGIHGERFLANLPASLVGLTSAQKRMNEFYNNGHRIRMEVIESVQALPNMFDKNNYDINIQLVENNIIVCENAIAALTACGTSETYINEIIFRHIASKLPRTFLNSFRTTTLENSSSELLEFARQQLRIIEAVENDLEGSVPQVASQSLTRVNLPRAQSQCGLCQGPHRTIRCTSNDATTRKLIAINKKLCLRCLRNGHTQNQCHSQYQCPCGKETSSVVCIDCERRRAQRQHPTNTSLILAPSASPPSTSTSSSLSTSTNHFETTQSPLHTEPKQIYPTNQTALISTVTNTKQSPLTTTYLQTLLVSINGLPTRVLLDTGASRSLISQDLVCNLQLHRQQQKQISFEGFEGQRAIQSNQSVVVTLNALKRDFSRTLRLCVVPPFDHLRVPSLPKHLIDRCIQKGFQLCESSTVSHLPIQVILGMDVYNNLLLDSEQRVEEGLYVRESVFGWIASGFTLHDNHDTVASVNIIATITATDYDFISTFPHYSSNINHLVSSSFTPFETKYLQDFIDNKIHLRDNRYSVNLPWLYPIIMADNRKVAHKRFLRLIRDLERRGLLQEYTTAIEEMIQKFAERVTSSKLINQLYYLPHHCVLRLDKTTTQLRVVFDGSSHDTNTRSLNDNLYKGPVGWDLITLLVKFRFGNTAVTADIEKAFLQISIEATDRDALRFFWFDEQHQPIEYRFKSVPFGTSASPFLLFATLTHHFSRYEKSFPKLIRTIANRLYVDDLLLTLDNPTNEELEQIHDQAIELFKLASMNLRKWRSNCMVIDKKWSPDAGKSVNILGHKWMVADDSLALNFSVDSYLNAATMTKRLFSSFVSSIYDPLGLVSPFVIQLRLFLRKLWQHKLNWDDSIPPECSNEAAEFIKQSYVATQLCVARNVQTGTGAIKLIVFCDANKEALGAVAYCANQINDKSTLNLIMSKAKLARDASIPELELDALILAATLAHHLQQIHNFESIIICSDSLLNLQRLLKHPNDQKPNIALRINTIKKLVPTARFQHVISQNNIADLITRGTSIASLIQNNLWWHGPPPSTSLLFDESVAQNIITIVNTPVHCRCTRFPSYGVALNTYRRVLRYFHTIQRLKHLDATHYGLILLIQSTQRLHFQHEMDALVKQQTIDKSSVLKNYNCFLDSNNLLRLRTRLVDGTYLSKDHVCPIILPYRCHFSDLVIISAHRQVFHGGVERTLSEVRDRFFIIGAKRMITHLVRKCSFCIRRRHIQPQISFGSIPTFRYDQNTAPFTNTGVDIFGPLKVSMLTPGKRYGVIYSCATTRSIHIELITAMTADQVFQSLRRFIGRRGLPRLLYSDNGTPIVAVKKRLLQFFHEIKQNHPQLELSISWFHLTASSPWRGGFYERLIRTIKESLLTLTSRRSIDDNELSTILIEIEARINDRPLFQTDGKTITPSHFIRGTKLMQLPSIGNIDARSITRTSIIDEYIKSQKSVNSVWRTWKTQYLLQLRSFHQNIYCAKIPVQLAIGDVVILHSSQPSPTWPLGIIRGLHRSPDGLIRTYDVETIERGRKVTKVRDLRTLIPLECSFEANDL